MTKSAVEQRIGRLVGDGKTSGAGALPLPDAFRGAMEQILDNGYATFGELVKRVTDEMHSKERRILGIWGSWDSFTIDIIEQLLARRLIRPEHNPEDDFSDDRWVTGMDWYLAEGIETSKYYDAITKNEVKRATGNPDAQPFRVILFDAGTRRERDAAARSMTIVRKARAELERLGVVDEVVGRHLEHVIARLEGTKLENDRPPMPPDEPDHIVTCKLGGEPRARTRDNFAIYWSRDQYYWRITCHEHSTGAETRRAKVRDAVLQMIDESGGKVPAVREVMRMMGKKDQKQTAIDWDYLAEKGELPRRV